MRTRIIARGVGAVGAVAVLLAALAEGKENCAYPDPASPLARELRKPVAKRVPGWQALSGKPWTIGHGHTGPDVKPGMCISDKEAERLLAKDLAIADAALATCVRAPVHENERGALQCWTLNVGGGAACGSTLVRYVNAGDYLAAANQFPRWNKAQGQVLPGLVKRRECEKRLFLTDPEKTSEADTLAMVKKCIEASR